MTVETQARELLLRAADEIEVGPPPEAPVLAAAVRRRRRLAVATAGVAAAAVVLAGAVIDRTDAPAPGSSQAASTSDPGPVSPNTREITQGEVTVDIPESWTSPFDGCWIEAQPADMTDTQIADSCPYLTDAAGLRARGLDADHDENWLTAARGGYDPVAGTSAVQVPTQAFSCLTFSCAPTYRGAILQEDLGLVLIVSSPDKRVVNSILDTARPNPDADCCLTGSVEIALPIVSGCGPLGGFGLVVPVSADPRAERVVVHLQVGDEVVGASDPLTLSTTEQSRVFANLYEPVPGGNVDVYVRPLHPVDGSATLDVMHDVHLDTSGPACS